MDTKPQYKQVVAQCANIIRFDKGEDTELTADPLVVSLFRDACRAIPDGRGCAAKRAAYVHKRLPN